MKLNVLDASGAPQTIVVNSIAVPVDHSGAIAATNVFQELLAANDARQGWFFQNISNADMLISELGEDDATIDSSWKVPAGGTWPPASFPLTVGQLVVTGTIAAKFVCREW